MKSDEVLCDLLSAYKALVRCDGGDGLGFASEKDILIGNAILNNIKKNNGELLA